MLRFLFALLACASATIPAPLPAGGSGGASLDPLDSSRFSTAGRTANVGSVEAGKARLRAGSGGGKLPKWLEKPPYWLPTPPEWGPPPAHIFTSWYQPQTIPQPVFRPSSYSRLAAAYGGAQPPGYFPPAYLASAYGGAYGGGGPAAALPGVGTSLYPLVSDPLAAAGVLLEQSAPAPQMSERRLRAVLAAHAALAAEGNSALPRFAALASASEKGEADFEDATAGADAAFVAEHELMQRHLRRQRRYRRPAR